jgi:hypothetical protein
LTRLPLGEPVEPPEPPDEPEPVIDGTDVTLRRPHPDDAPALFAATHGDEEREAVWTYMGYGPPCSLGYTRAIVVSGPRNPPPRPHLADIAARRPRTRHCT